MTFMLGMAYYVQQTRKLSALDAVENYSLTLLELHRYFSEISTRAERSGLTLTDKPAVEADSVPFPATMTMDFGQRLEQMEAGLSSSMFSFYPFPKRSERELDSFQRAALEHFATGQREPFVRFEDGEEGLQQVRYALPIVMEPQCVDCHNSAGLGVEWAVGDLRGAREVSVPVAELDWIHDEILVYGLFFTLFTAGLGSALMLPTFGLLRRTLTKRQEMAELLMNQNTELQETALIRDRVLDGVKHDLKNPLNAIVGFSDLMNSESFGPIENKRYQDYIKAIHDSGLHMQKLIEAMSVVPDPDKGQWPFQEQAIDLNVFFRELTPVLKSWVEASEIELVVSVPHQTAKLNGDFLLLRRIVVNLVDNAIKYSGARTITIGLEKRTDLQGQPDGLAFYVADNGRGIPRACLEELSSKGVRHSCQDGQGPEGTGLGLWLVDQFARLHNARLEIESTLGRGSCFCVVFPASGLVGAEGKTD
ncbi:ATP-binding protein [Kiloniella sp. b19]|uniref:ATP-binding protein n=1 Tax=Kiloniella sp. GXU_MW_B19 TaxID=3141326 RepID=UPI0031D097D8